SVNNASNVKIVASGDGFDVQLSYTYLEELTNQTFSVSVTDHNASTSASSSSFSVADAKLTAGPLTPPVAIEGAPFNNTLVFHFTDADPNGTASDYVATVHTGDAILPSNANPSNLKIVSCPTRRSADLSYTYLEELTNQTFSVSVTDHNASTSASTSSFSVADAKLTAGPLTPPIAI